MSFALVIEIARLALGGAIGLAGLAVIALGVVGLLRFPDLFSRAHAYAAMAGFGAAAVLLGLALIAWDGALSVRLAILAAVLGVVAPTAAHLTVGAAHAAGLSPLSGAYTAPRPDPSNRSGGA